MKAMMKLFVPEVKSYNEGTVKGCLIKVPNDSSDYRMEAEYRPYSVWLYARGLKFPMPIGNMIYPYNHTQLEIKGTKEDEDGKWLFLQVKNVP